MATTHELAARVEAAIPLAFYQWIGGIERDVRVWDLTPNEIASLIAALRAQQKDQDNA